MAKKIRLRILLPAVLLAALPSLAHAQATIKQLGPVVPGHIPMYAGNGQLMDAGGPQIANGPPVNGTYPGTRPGGLGIVNSGVGFAAFEKPANAANYSQLMWGFDGSGNGLVTFDRIGAGGPFTVNCRINGTLYANCLQGGGNVGTVTSIIAGAGLAGGTITGAGTISLVPIAANALFGNPTGGNAVPIAMGLPPCDDIGGQHINYAGGTLFCGFSSSTPLNVLIDGGPLGTPSSGNAINLTGLPLSSGVAGVLPPANGGTGQSAWTDGQLPIGNTATGGLSKATLIAGSGIGIANGNGTITITNTGGGGGGGAASAGVSGDIQTGDGLGGFVALTPGAGVSTFLATPAGNVPAPWLAAGAAASNLGFTPPPNTRTITAGPGLSGGGDLTANRTLSVNATQVITAISNLTGNGLVKTGGGVGTLGIAVSGTDYAPATSGAANTPQFSNGLGGFTAGTRSGSTTRTVTMDASTPATNDCAKWDVSHNLTTFGGPCGGAPGGADGQIQYRVNSSTFGGVTVMPGLDMTAGALSLAQVFIDRSGAGVTIPSSDGAKTVLVGGFTYTLPMAGSAGFGTNFGTCFLNVTGGTATLNTTTSVFKGAGGASSLTLAANKWACVGTVGSNYAALTN